MLSESVNKEIFSTLIKLESKTKILSESENSGLHVSLIRHHSQYYDFCKSHPKASANYLSEVISDKEILSWTAQKPVFISSPTGSGKTSWLVYEKLIPLAIKSKRRIIILCNRSRLCRQMKIDLMELVGDNPNIYTTSALDNIEFIGEYISILTYVL